MKVSKFLESCQATSRPKRERGRSGRGVVLNKASYGDMSELQPLLFHIRSLTNRKQYLFHMFKTKTKQQQRNKYINKKCSPVMNLSRQTKAIFLRVASDGCKLCWGCLISSKINFAFLSNIYPTVVKKSTVSLLPNSGYSNTS